MKRLNHCDPIDIQLVCFVIIAVKCLLSESKGSMDGLGKLDVLTSLFQVFVDVVMAGIMVLMLCALHEKKKGAMLENLILRVV